MVVSPEIRSPDERSEIRDFCVACGKPGLRYAHPGYGLYESA
jgi:hypothetical protein